MNGKERFCIGLGAFFLGMGAAPEALSNMAQNVYFIMGLLLVTASPYVKRGIK